MSSSFDSAVEFAIPRPRKFPWLNVVLFGLTCLSTLVVGVFLMGDFNGALPQVTAERLWREPSSVLSGLPFCLAIMGILFCHEMGHYLTCRYYGVDASLPYFIPFPTIVGTMGAFIRIRAPIRDRGSLLEIGVAGPIAGFVVALILLVFSLGQAHFLEPHTFDGAIELGEPLIFKIVQFAVGMTPPEGKETFMHPISFAAWFGFLATALNLLPVAQLDGGHIAYAIFRGYHRWISRIVVAVLVPLAIFYWVGWFVWIALLLVLKLQHPPTLNDSIPLQRRHIVLGWIGLALLILCFMPAPIRL
jgi:membrane-associated protease RseP (regulator of RpoE activity)